jgi:7-cyano-7-deazaguanine synthase
MKSVLIFSGGLDSTTLLYSLMNKGHEVYPITFSYGQKHVKEIEIAAKIASKLGLKHIIINLPTISGNSLTDNLQEIPSGEYSIDSQKTTVVPNRNMIFISHAVSIAIAEGISEVYYGAHKNDATVYPDCRPEFVESIQRAVILGNYESVLIKAPFVDLTKEDIVRLGNKLKVPFEETWSCYRGEEIHCGFCGTCMERRLAFSKANVYDPTIYRN